MKEILWRHRFKITRVAFTLLFIIVTTLQVFSFPGQFSHMRRASGISLIIELALTLLFGIWMLCAQTAIFALWKIIGFMEKDMFFTHSSLRWIDRLVTALKTAVIVPALLFLTLASEADDPGFFVLLSAIGLFLFSLAIISVLFREQIRSRLVD